MSSGETKKKDETEICTVRFSLKSSLTHTIFYEPKSAKHNIISFYQRKLLFKSEVTYILFFLRYEL